VRNAPTCNAVKAGLLGFGNIAFSIKINELPQTKESTNNNNHDFVSFFIAFANVSI
jgi:GTPase involved in cell partitioning and DNA repair